MLDVRNVEDQPLGDFGPVAVDVPATGSPSTGDTEQTDLAGGYIQKDLSLNHLPNQCRSIRLLKKG